MECKMEVDPPSMPSSNTPPTTAMVSGTMSISKTNPETSTSTTTNSLIPPSTSSTTTPVIKEEDNQQQQQNQQPEIQDETLLKYQNAIIRLNVVKDSKGEIEMKRLLQELNNNLEAYILNPKYHGFFMTTLPIILKYLDCGAKNFIKEHNDSQIRQLVLELLSRFPIAVTKLFLGKLFPVLYNIIESDNEDNACIAFRIVVELHKRISKLNDEMKKFLLLIKKFTLMLIQNAPKILEPFKSYHVRSMEELDLEPILQEIFIATSLQTDNVQCFTLLPRGINSLKLLTEVPINIIMLSQIYRGFADAEMFELLQIALKLVVIQPAPEQRANELFNVEIYTDFLYVQIKFFSYIAFMARSQEEKVQSLMVGERLPRIILTLFKSMPDELTNLRKDLLYSTRYIVSTRFRNYFAPYIEEFFDESIIIGKGWTTNETLRSFAYSIVYDLVHHLRDSLGLKELNLAVNIYSKNLYDDSLSLSIQIMSCRLLLNISDSYIKVAEREKAIIHLPGMMLKILEIFTNKICLMAKYSIPNIKTKLNAATAKAATAAESLDEAPNFNDNRSNYKSNIEYLASSFINNDDFRLNFGIPEPQNSSIVECRMLGRTLLNGLKVLSAKLSDLSHRSELSVLAIQVPENQLPPPLKTGYCRPRDIYILIRLFKKGIKLLEIFNLNSFPNSTPNMVLNYLNRQQSNSSQMAQIHARTKEEKDAIETFSMLFTVLAPQTFRVVIESTIDYFVECLRDNCNIQQLAHCFLANKNTSPIFANILTAYLVERMEIMGKNTEMSNLFLKLFKLVFGSVSLFPSENEQMLQPHLQQLVINSMRMAMTAQEPYNYFMILRALFRSIGGGSHDQLYQQFLPMLPSLLQGLNNFQTGIHRQNMKDLFVELCLTIPVRLSSLLPYLPWLMDPLVSALNGAPNLISQGLRTLELCVDNLQPDFLYEHIQPIRIELMQSLWRTLRYQNDRYENIAQVSFRILGKLGGTNHRMMIEPQKLEYIDFRDPPLDENERNEERRQIETMTNVPTHGTYSFIEIKFEDSQTSIHLPVDKVIEAAYRGLRLSTLDSFYRQQCWQVIHGFLLANMQNFTTEEEKNQLIKLFSHSSFSTGTDFGYSSTNSFSLSSAYSSVNKFYKFPDEKLRKVHVLALTAMFTASAIKETSASVISFMVPLVRHYTMVAICQQAGPINISGRTVKLHGMDPLVLIDAIKAIMCEEERELCKPCHMTISVIIETTVKVLGSKERACQLPLYDYILERICALCYERAWYSKYNGCFTVRYLFERMSLRWLFGHQFIILKAMLFVIMDLSNDLSSGVIEMAKDNLETIVKICGSPLPENSPRDLADLKQKSMAEVVQELLRQIQSSNTIVREQVMHLLEVLAKTVGCTVTDIIRPHKELLDDMVPFKKQRLFQLPVKVQIGILDGNTFCITLEPQLFVLDIEIPEHSNFFDDVLAICENDDDQLLLRFPCYKNAGSLTPVRKAALRMLSACHYLRPKLNKIFFVLYKALMSSKDEQLQECAYNCMEKYEYIKDVNPELIRTTARASLLNISEIRTLSYKDLPLIKRLKNLARLFTCLFNDKLCEHMLNHLHRAIEACVKSIREFREVEIKLRMNPNQEQSSVDLCKLAESYKGIPRFLSIGVEIIYLFCEISAADSSYVESLLNILVRVESLLDIYAYMTYYKPIQKFMKRYPKEAIAQLEQRMSEDSIYRFFLHVLQNEEGQLFRAVLYENPSRLVNLLTAKVSGDQTMSSASSSAASSPMVTCINQNSQQSPQQVPVPASTVDVTSSPAPVNFLGGMAVSRQTYSRYQAIKIVHILIKHDEAWLNTQPELVKALKSIWLSDSFHVGHQENFTMDSKQWEEPRLLVKCLLNHLSHNRHEFEMYFQLLRAFIGKYHCDFEFLREIFVNDIAKKSTIEWRQNAFRKFCELFRSTNAKFPGLDCSLEWSQDLKAKILKYIIIPTFSNAFENGQTTELLGPVSDDDFQRQQLNKPNLVSIYLNVLVKDLTVADSVRILLMQLGCLIVEHASNYIRPPQISENERIPRSKRKNAEVRQLVEYAWPGMHATKRQDTMKKYYCHLLLTHIISKISIHKDIIKQVFLNLLKGYYNESRAIVFNALEILIPVLPQRIKDGYRMLRQLTKKLIIEESHSSNQLTHLLQIIVRYYRIYYPTRHTYVPHMVYNLQRFGLAPSSAIEHRKLSIDLVEVIIRWEHERISAEQLDKSDKPADVDSSDSESSFDSKSQQSSQNKSPGGGSSGGPSNQETQLSQGSIEKEYSDTILHFLIRFICSVNDFTLPQNSPTQINSMNTALMPDFLCRRALNLLKDALQNEFWPLSDIKLTFLERLLLSVNAKDQPNQQNPTNFISVCMALELLILLLETLKRDVAIQMLGPLQKAIFACCQSTNPKVVAAVHNLLTKMMAIVPPSCHSSTISPKSGQPVKVVNDSLETFEQLYTDIHSLILNGFMSYNKNSSGGNVQATPILNSGNIQGTNPAGINAQMMHLNRGPGGQPGMPGSALNSTTTSLSQLFTVLMCLKAACLNEPAYIDRLSTPFSVMLQKLVKEHVTSVQTNYQAQDFNASLCADIINLCLELIKNRIGALNNETRRNLITQVFTHLIDKSPEVKVMKTLLKIFEEWIKQPMASTQSGSRASSSTVHSAIVPVLREKTALMQRIGQNIEKRFGDDLELQAQYLELIHYIYADDTLKSSDMANKLEFSFMSGLRCPQPHIREKFFALLDNSLRKRLYDRVMHIICAQNWDMIGAHYWIRQAIELILAVSDRSSPIATTNQNAKLPLPTSLIPLNEPHDKSLLTDFTSSGINSMVSCVPNDIMDLLSFDTRMTDPFKSDDTNRKSENSSGSFLNDLLNNQSQQQQANNSSGSESRSDPTQCLLENVCTFLWDNRDHKSWSFFNAMAQLCHLDMQLAHHIWIQLFPRIYSIMNERQQVVIALEISEFFVSGVHQYQRDAPISSVNTFFEAVSYCDPPIKFRPPVLRYLSKNHNFWHRASLLLEQEMNGPHVNRPATGIGGLITNDVNHNHIAVASAGPKHTRSAGAQVAAPNQVNSAAGGDKLVSGNQFNPASATVANIQELFPSELPASLSQPYGHECMSALAHIYEILKEQDYWAGIWPKRAQYHETLTAIAYEQQGFFEQAKGAYELAMSKGANDYSNSPIPYWLQDEYALWENHWIRCSKELNQWDFLLEYGSTPELANPLLVLESAWRIPDWKSMSKAVTLVEQNLPKDFAWKLALYKGYNSLCNPDIHDLDVAERMVEVAANFLLKEWRRLPPIVSSAHISILQGAHQVIELQEAFNLHQILFGPTNPICNNETPGSNLRSVIKTWKNRLPIVADDLSHWSDIFTWRQHHYQAIVTCYEQESKMQQQQGNNAGSAASNALCGAHASAQSLIHLAKVARKHLLVNVALDQLNRIHTIPKVPIVDCFQKIRQQLKCYLLKHALQPSGDELHEAMAVIDCTHLHFFQNEMMAEFIAFKGYVQMKMGQMEEANKNFSASLQLLDTLVNGWAMWAEYNYEMFMASVQESFAQRNMQHGINAIISFLHAARHQNEAKARKFLSHVLWLLSYDQDNKFAKTIEQYNLGVPIYNWVPWIQQLLHCLVGSEGQMMMSILLQISKHYPEAVYFPTRTMYLTLKMEQREKNQIKLKFAQLSSSVINSQQSGSGSSGQQPSTDQVQASSGMLRCSRIMHHQRDFHPALLTSIEGILDQLSWFREISWFEELLRQLRQMLVKCYAIAFENRTNVAETATSHHTFNYIRKLVSTFGNGIDNASTGANQGRGRVPMGSTASETLARRAQSTVQDPDFQKMKQQFANDFDFSGQGSPKLHNLIIKLKKWIKILEAKAKTLPKSWLLEEKCRYLSNFSQQIAEVALPGEFFLPKGNSVVHIARFMPRVEVINKHNVTARRLYIRGHNGKIYPYLVLNDSSPGEVRREERFLHLLRLMNLYLTKHKETARRVLSFTVPRVVPITGQMRFVEDNVSSLSLIEIYKQHMIRRGSDPDAPIAKYYDRLLSLQTKGSQVSLSQLKDIISDIQVSMAPKTLLRDWASQTFSTATEFWHFRKLFTLQLGLAGLAEYAFHLTRLNPDMMYIHRDSGLVNISYYRFDLSEETGELVSNQPVPFRVTHSVQNLITDIGIRGPLTATMIATAGCLIHPNYKVRSILNAIFRDEIITWHKRVKTNEKMALISAAITAVANSQQQQANRDPKNPDQQQQQHQHLVDMINSPNFNDIPEITAEELVTSVTKAVNAIMSRLKNLAMFEGADSNVATLIKQATNPDNLCRMDPAWHPWL